MAIDKKGSNPPISAAPVAIATNVNAGIANRSASTQQPLKAATLESRLKPEIAQSAPNAQPQPSTEEIAVTRYRQMQLMGNLADDLLDNIDDLTTAPLAQWAKENPNEVGTNFNPADRIDNAYARFRQANPDDRAITADFEGRVQAPFAYNPRIPSHAGRDRNAPTAVIDDGFKAPTFKLDKQQARTALAADIRTVSEMYAAEAGMSPKDFARVMGGIATIESSFGVLRDVKGTKYASSAGGAFHYLNGTIAGEVRQNISDPRIANRVAALGVTLKDGVAKSEAWTMKDDNILAGSILAKNIVEAVRANPSLKDDIGALTTRVYQAHNLGDAGARALARGGRQALEALDHRADDNNPMFFRGTSSDAEINARYTKFVTNAIASSDTLVTAAFDGAPATALAAAKPDKKPVAVASIAAPEPRPA